MTDQASKQRKSVTDALGRLKTVYEPDTYGTLNVNTDYTYDVLNNLTGVLQGSQTRSYVYDNLSRLTSATNPESGTTYYTSYDGNGNLTGKTDANSISTSYTYDALNRVTYRDYSDSTPDVTYTYDNVTNAIGRLTKVSNSNSETWYTAFDKMGRATAHKQRMSSTDYTTAYTYNLAGMLLEETYPSGRMVKNTIGSYGDLSQVETKPSGGSYATRAGSFVYAAPGAVESLQLGNGKYETTQFNSRLQPTQIGLGTSTSDTSLLKLEYTYNTPGYYDNNGNVLTQKITVPGLTYTFNQSYSYDNLNRLASATETYNGSQTWTQSYGYDRYGNRNITSGTGATSLAFDPYTNKITTSGYSYDYAGNTTADPSGKSYAYDAENKQKQVSNGSGTLGQYLYDGDGRRVKKYNTATSDDAIFLYDAAGKLLEERDLTGTSVQVSYIYAGSRLLSTETPSGGSTAPHYVTADHLGTPRANTNSSGTVTARHDYMPFGEEIFSALTSQRTTAAKYVGVDGVRKQFTGYERDSESNHDYAQARYSASTLGRFMSPDPLVISLERQYQPSLINLYAYAGNNPLKFTDPTGMWTWSAALGGNRSDADISREVSDLGEYQGKCEKSNDCDDLDAVMQRLNNLSTILTQRASIRASLKLANTVVGIFGNYAGAQANLRSALTQYGAEGDNNDVIIGIRDPKSASGVAFTKVEGSRRIVAITESEIGNENSLFATLIHEGRHLEQASNYLSSGTNTVLWQAEYEAYAYASVAAVGGQLAAKVPPASATYSAGSTMIGNGAWSATQTETGIKTHLVSLGLMQVKNNIFSPTVRGSAGAFPGGGLWH